MLSDEWSSLLQRSVENEPMRSPEWLITWWRHYGTGRKLRVMTVRRGEQLIGLAPMCSHRAPYRELGWNRIEFLGTGEASVHASHSEYVGLIAERGAEQEVAETFGAALRDGTFGRWDEVRLTAMSSQSAMLPLVAHALGPDCRYDVIGGAPFLSLPDSWEAYLEQRSRSNRYLIRRSLQAWERWAGSPPVLDEIKSKSELDDRFDRLHLLHELRWAEAGSAGAFVSPVFRAFHRDVMERLFERNALWLAELEAQGESVAAVYSLRWDGKVRFYQSGRKLDVPPKVRPGLVIHLAAIREAIRKGYTEYDFLGGTAHYKMQLSSNVRPLVKLTLARKPSLRRRVVGIGRSGTELVRTLRELKAGLSR